MASPFRIRKETATTDLLNIPTINDVFTLINNHHFRQPRHALVVSLLALTGCRVSELLTISRSHLRFFNGPVLVGYPDEDCSNVTQVNISIETLKKRSQKDTRRTIPIAVYSLNKIAVGYVIRSYNALTDPMEQLVKYPQRTAINKMLRKEFDDRFYPHLFRHISATTDSINGMYPTMIKKKYGWDSDEMAGRYFDLNPQELLDSQMRVNSNVVEGLAEGSAKPSKLNASAKKVVYDHLKANTLPSSVQKTTPKARLVLE